MPMSVSWGAVEVEGAVHVFSWQFSDLAFNRKSMESCISRRLGSMVAFGHCGYTLYN